jgi:hypothetical protein
MENASCAQWEASDPGGLQGFGCTVEKQVNCSVFGMEVPQRVLSVSV